MIISGPPTSNFRGLETSALRGLQGDPAAAILPPQDATEPAYCKLRNERQKLLVRLMKYHSSFASRPVRPEHAEQAVRCKTPGRFLWVASTSYALLERKRTSAQGVLLPNGSKL